MIWSYPLKRWRVQTIRRELENTPEGTDGLFLFFAAIILFNLDLDDEAVDAMLKASNSPMILPISKKVVKFFALFIAVSPALKTPTERRSARVRHLLFEVFRLGVPEGRELLFANIARNFDLPLLALSVLDGMPENRYQSVEWLLTALACARAAGMTRVALGYCDRILAIEPEHPQALAAVREIAKELSGRPADHDGADPTR